MDRRRALAIAAATAATTIGAATAIAANFGLLGFGATDPTPLGQLDAGRVTEVVNPGAGSPPASNPAPNVTVRYEDVYLSAPPSPAPLATPPPPADQTSSHPASGMVGGTSADTTGGGGAEPSEVEVEADHDQERGEYDDEDGREDGHEEDHEEDD